MKKQPHRQPKQRKKRPAKKTVGRTRSAIIKDINLASAAEDFETTICKAFFCVWDSDRQNGQAHSRCNVASPELRDRIVEMDRDWIIDAMLLMRDSQGEFYYDTHRVHGWGVRVNDMADKYNATMKVLLDKCNEDHIIDAGYVVRPWGGNLKYNVEVLGKDPVLKHLFDNRILECRFSLLDKASGE